MSYNDYMAKRQFQLDGAQINALICAYNKMTDGATRTRFQAVRLYGTGYLVKDIIEITQCSRTSLMEWCQKYLAHGPGALVDHRAGGNSRKLRLGQIADLSERLRLYTPGDLFGSEAATSEGRFWTVEDLQRVVERWYGVSYQSRTSCVTLFARCGFSYQRPARVYKSRREADVAAFEEAIERKLVDLAQEAPDTVTLVEDEASLYLQATVKQVWAPRRQPPVVRVDPRRDKTSFYGTLDLATGNDIVTESPKMNGAATVEHLAKVLDTYPGRPILLLWDRATWHKGPLVREFLAAHPRLELMYFPVAAPDLNPQEHVWKTTRGAISHNHAQRRLPDLADKFAAYLNTHTFHSSFLDRYGYNAIRPMFT